MRRIVIVAGDVTLPAELNDSPTADKVWEQLPVQAEANTWGDEIYFEIPVIMEQAPDARADVDVWCIHVEVGEVAPGNIDIDIGKVPFLGLLELRKPARLCVNVDVRQPSFVRLLYLACAEEAARSNHRRGSGDAGNRLM